MMSHKKIVPDSGDPSNGCAVFRMTCWGDTSKQTFVQLFKSIPKRPAAGGYAFGQIHVEVIAGLT